MILNESLFEAFDVGYALDSNTKKQIDLDIKNAWGEDYPGEGCIFIHPDGSFLNIYPKLDDHEDLCYWLEDEGYDSDYIVEDPAWLTDTFNYIRCRNSVHLCFIALPDSKVTSAQLDSLERWMEEKVTSDYIDVVIENTDEQQHYSTEEYFPEDIISKIKRFYASGRLYEEIDSMMFEESYDQKKSEIYYRFEVFDHNNRKISGGLFRGLNKFLEKLYRDDDPAYEDLNYWVAHLEYVTPFPKNFDNNKAKFAYKESFVNKYKDHFDKISELLDDLDWELLESKVQVKNSDVVYEDDVQIAYTKGVILEEDMVSESLTESRKKRKKISQVNPGEAIFKSVSDMKKWVKKRQKGMSSFCYLNPNAGNVPLSNNIFNSMFSSDSSSGVGTSEGGVSNGGLSSSDAGVGMGESFNPDLKLKLHYTKSLSDYLTSTEQEFIRNNMDLIDSERWLELKDKVDNTFDYPLTTRAIFKFLADGLGYDFTYFEELLKL